MDLKMKTEDLNFYYGDFRALTDINMNIENKKITALIGPSGCGKSTFIASLNRMSDLIDDTRILGKISLDGKNIHDDDVDVIELRKRVGMLFQKPNPFPKSIYENVIYGPKRYGGVRKSELDEIVEKSLVDAALWGEVKDKLHQSALELSGGQQQRLCIARCLAAKPEVLLMDEPTSALDPLSTFKIEELFEELKKHYAIVIVTHSMHQAARISDNTAFFLNGELIEFGNSHMIFTKPNKKLTEEYISGRFG